MTLSVTKIAVVIPTYNGAAYLADALESVFRQTVPPVEVIVADDASRDDTAALVLRLARSAPVPLRLVRSPRNSGGPASPMNRGVRHCRAEYVALLDQDDRMAATKIETALALFQQFPHCGLAFGQEMPFGSDGTPRPLPADFYACFPDRPACLTPEAMLETLVIHGYRLGGAGGTLFRKQAWESVGGFDRRYRISWDFDFTVRLAVQGWAFAYAPTVFHWHRLHESNLNGAGEGMLVYCENQWVQLNALGRGRLPAAAARLVKERVVPELSNLGYWERRLGHPQRALRAYLLALRHGTQVGVAARGACRVAAKVVHDLIRGAPRAARP